MYYPTLRHVFTPADFEYPEDMVSKQLVIRDIDGSPVRPWWLLDMLVEGASFSAIVSIVVWEVDHHAVSIGPGAHGLASRRMISRPLPPGALLPQAAYIFHCNLQATWKHCKWQRSR
jgi:hypothetical protein